MNSSQMEKLAVVHIKQLGVGGWGARQGGAKQGLGSIRLILSELNSGCQSEPSLLAGGDS